MFLINISVGFFILMKTSENLFFLRVSTLFRRNMSIAWPFPTLRIHKIMILNFYLRNIMVTCQTYQIFLNQWIILNIKCIKDYHGKALIHLFFLKSWINSWSDWLLSLSLANGQEGKYLYSNQFYSAKKVTCDQSSKFLWKPPKRTATIKILNFLMIMTMLVGSGRGQNLGKFL